MPEDSPHKAEPDIDRPVSEQAPDRCASRQTNLVRVLCRFLVIFLLIFVGFYMVFYFAQTPMVFQSERQLHGDPSVHGWQFQEVVLPVLGETTHGWFIPLENARGVILYSHGNDSNISACLGEVRLFRDLGFSVLMYDYGGFGKSTGSPSEKRVNADVAAMWSYLTETCGIPAEKIVLWGRSFGGGATCELASRVKPVAVILESTFTSMADAAFRDYPWFPARLFLRHRFENAQKVAQFQAPLLVIHSLDDTLYPFEHGRELYERAPEPKSFLEIRGDHGEGAYISKDIYVKGIRDFLEDVFPIPTGGG